MNEEEMEMKMTSLINLPGDVLINKILLKFDTKFFGRLRCVCKYFRSFISSPAFLNMHICHQHNNNNSLVLLVSGDKTLFYFFSLNGTHIKPYCPEKVEMAGCPRFCPEKVEMAGCPRFSCPEGVEIVRGPVFLGSCNGLLCLVDRENHPPSLWNPTTKEYKELPPPLSPRSSSIKTPFLSDHMTSSCTSVVVYGLGYDSIINDYKLIQCENLIYRQYFLPVRPGHITENTITDFQVYTLGTDTWRRINDNPYWSYSTPPSHYQTPGMFVNGALHWILRETKSFGSKIIAFDIEKEMFRAEVPKPHSNLSDSSCNWSLHVLKGCLCIYERLERELSPCIDIWMMKDYGTMESWTKLFTINDYSAIASCGLDFKVLKFCENGKVIVAGDDGRKGLILYDPINSESQTINFGEIPGGISYKEIRIESLVSLNTGIYRYMVENKPPEEIKKKRKRLT